MMESVQNALDNELDGQEAKHRTILDKLEAYAEDHPGTNFYIVRTEHEAQQILVAMAAICKQYTQYVDNKKDKQELVAKARDYRLAVIHSKALEYIKKQSKDTQMVIHGLNIEAARIVLQ